MTKLEKARQIANNGDCSGIRCEHLGKEECPFYNFCINCIMSNDSWRKELLTLAKVYTSKNEFIQEEMEL